MWIRHLVDADFVLKNGDRVTRERHPDLVGIKSTSPYSLSGWIVGAAGGNPISSYSGIMPGDKPISVWRSDNPKVDIGLIEKAWAEDLAEEFAAEQEAKKAQVVEPHKPKFVKPDWFDENTLDDWDASIYPGWIVLWPNDKFILRRGDIVTSNKTVNPDRFANGDESYGQTFTVNNSDGELVGKQKLAFVSPDPDNFWIFRRIDQNKPKAIILPAYFADKSLVKSYNLFEWKGFVAIDPGPNLILEKGDIITDSQSAKPDTQENLGGFMVVNGIAGKPYVYTESWRKSFKHNLDQWYLIRKFPDAPGPMKVSIKNGVVVTDVVKTGFRMNAHHSTPAPLP